MKRNEILDIIKAVRSWTAELAAISKDLSDMLEKIHETTLAVDDVTSKIADYPLGLKED